MSEVGDATRVVVPAKMWRKIRIREGERGIVTCMELVIQNDDVIGGVL